MAGGGHTWHLFGLLVTLPYCLPQPGPPPPPSIPQCHIPHEESEELNLDFSIHCSWKPGQQDPLVPTSYIMHWRSEDNNTSGQVEVSSVGGVLPRKQFLTHSVMSVWVMAVNEHGNAMSQRALFDTENIRKPPTPIILSHSHQSVEIFWRSRCDLKGLSETGCEVRHRADENSDWTQEEGQFELSFHEDSPPPFTKYEFQVRCACLGSELMSNWSSSYTVLSAEAAPVEKLDVWIDCGISTDNLECVLMWKKLPRELARGQVLGYSVKLSYINGTQAWVNVSAADPGDWLICNETQCYLTFFLRGVSGANVSAFNAHGATTAAPLAMPTSGLPQEGQYNMTVLKMDGDKLSVSWMFPQNPPDGLQEYVIQYKGAGLPLTQGFDWIRVNKTEKSAILTGTFENVTAYVVSLFAVLKGSCQRLSSAIEYFSEETPPNVPSFKEESIAATEVTLSWEPIPLVERKGHILHYVIGVSLKNQNNSTKQVILNEGCKTYAAKNLQPGQDYLVWICAVTRAGAGSRSEIVFTTKEKFSYDHFIYLPVITLLFIFLLFSFFRLKEAQVIWWCWEKVPDPSHSKLFQQMMYQQLNDSLTWFSAPCMEPGMKSHLDISEVEVIQIQTLAFNACSGETSGGMTEGRMEEECILIEREGEQGEDDDIEEGRQRKEGRSECGKEDYSKMIDSDEDRETDEISDSQSLEESGYEKHFMPTVFEVEQ